MNPESGVARFLSDTLPLPGYHVCHFSLSEDLIKVQVYRDSYSKLPALQFSESSSVGSDGETFRRWIEARVGIVRQTNEWPVERKQPWAFFSTVGVRLNSVQEVLQTQEVFILEGGQFIWPPVRVGHKTLLNDLPGNDGGPLELETLSLQPIVFQDEECDIIIQSAEPQMIQSQVYNNDADRGKPAVEWRTSTQTWLSSKTHSFIRDIDQRVAALTRVPLNHQEDVQVLRYALTQKYNAHLDCFDPRLYSQQPDRLESVDYGHKNRLATVFWYMSSVDEGGETVFPRAGGLSEPSSMADMNTGLLVKPEQGKVIVFYSLQPNGNVDHFSLHGGAPVKKGLKWAANKWVWNKSL